jgi:TatA/E family protein of Tat protein translocase
MFNIGPLELMVILLLALVVVGPSRLPEVGRSIGKGLRELRKVQDEMRDSINFNLDEPIRPPKPTPARRNPRRPERPAPAPRDDDPVPASTEGSVSQTTEPVIDDGPRGIETRSTEPAVPAEPDVSKGPDPAVPATGSPNGSTPTPEAPQE